MNRWCALALLLAVAGALALRCAKLDARPLHGDEAINATKLAAFVARGEYKYDPLEFHGPSLIYAARVITPSTFTDGELRYVTVAFGVGLLLLLLLLRDALGQTATACAAILLAVSPAMVFYSRYFIHEMLLVFFTLLTLTAGWRFHQSRKPVWAMLAGAGIGLMFVTKETFVFSVLAMIAAASGTIIWDRREAEESGIPAATSSRPAVCSIQRGLTLCLLVTVVVWFFFFSSFFTNWKGLGDSFTTYTAWFNRAGGNSPHNQPWWFYLERVIWFHKPRGPVFSEGAILLLAIVGAAAGFCGNRAAIAQPVLARFLTFYTLMLMTVYSVISYKTPWCLLNFWLGAIMLAGIGAATLLAHARNARVRTSTIALLLAATAHLAIQSWSASVMFSSSPKNPYVYAHTSANARELVKRVEAIARVSADRASTPVKVIATESYWPLPWYLREFSKIGWWDALPSDPLAPIILVSSKLDARLDEKSNKSHLMTGIYELRPNVFLELYVERGLWEKFVTTLPRDAE